MGLEPTTFGLEVQRAIHCATRARTTTLHHASPHIQHCHTHPPTDIHTHKRASTLTGIRTRTHTYPHTHTPTHTPVHTHAHAYTHTRVTPTLLCAHTDSHASTHTHPHTHSHTCDCNLIDPATPCSLRLAPTREVPGVDRAAAHCTAMLRLPRE